jgi:hypothetical protein
VRQLAAELIWGGLPGQVIDQLVLRHREPSAHLFAALQERQAFSGDQRVETQIPDAVDRGI